MSPLRISDIYSNCDIWFSYWATNAENTYLHLLNIILALYCFLSNYWKTADMEKHSKVTPGNQTNFS